MIAFPQVRPCFPVSVAAVQRQPKPRVIVPLQRVSRRVCASEGSPLKTSKSSTLTSADFARMAGAQRPRDRHVGPPRLHPPSGLVTSVLFPSCPRRSGDPSSPQVVLKKSGRDRRSPTTSNGPVIVFPHQTVFLASARNSTAEVATHRAARSAVDFRLRPVITSTWRRRWPSVCRWIPNAWAVSVHLRSLVR